MYMTKTFLVKTRKGAIGGMHIFGRLALTNCPEPII